MDVETTPTTPSQSKSNPSRPSQDPSLDQSQILSKMKKKVYLKLDKAQLKSLKESFVLTEYYPKKTQIDRLSKELDIEVTKIENWLKYERRKLSKLTYLQKYKKRKRFSETDLGYLRAAFETNPCPSKAQMEAIALKIHCSTKNIENWFGNYKKKVKSQHKFHKPSRNQEASTSPKPLIKEIKLEDTGNHHPTPLAPQPQILPQPQPQISQPQMPKIQFPPPLPPTLPPMMSQMMGQHIKSELGDPLMMMDPAGGFFESLKTYMTSPEVLEMQKKNMALTQNFMMYQQLFQTYLMMNFKKRLENATASVMKKEEDSQRPKGEMPLALQNMLNFINNNLKERERPNSIRK